MNDTRLLRVSRFTASATDVVVVFFELYCNTKYKPLAVLGGRYYTSSRSTGRQCPVSCDQLPTWLRSTDPHNFLLLHALMLICCCCKLPSFCDFLSSRLSAVFPFICVSLHPHSNRTLQDISSTLCSVSSFIDNLVKLEFSGAVTYLTPMLYFRVS